MFDISLFFKNQRADRKKLLAFGFKREVDSFSYQAPLMKGDFELLIKFCDNGQKLAEIIDVNMGEAYILSNIAGVSGTFIGKLRLEYEEILHYIAAQCFRPEVFNNRQTLAMIDYAAKKYQDTPEFLWEKSPQNAIIRRKSTQKWYVVFITLDNKKLGFDEAGDVEIMNLHATKEKVSTLVDKQIFLPAYHMNKQHWFTVRLNGSVSDEELFRLIDESYDLALK